MREVETIIVGGGPAGSSCAGELVKAGSECLVLEKETMPRVKLCAGWVTPKVFKDLEIKPQNYPHGLVSLKRFKIRYGKKGRSFNLPTKQYSIRRVEFDHWLLQRSGAEVLSHRVKKIRRENGRFIIDESFSCRHLVGAGGSNCPVRKQFFGDPTGEKVLAREIEYSTDHALKDLCTLWVPFAGKGYAWCVQKSGALNIGFGGLASGLNPAQMGQLWDQFTNILVQSKSINGERHPPAGWFYYLNQPKKDLPVKKEGAFLIGDSAGLATGDLGEGIGPAVESGILAAREILGKDTYSTKKITPYSIPGLFPYLPQLVTKALLGLVIRLS